eukprot:7380801-Prymnesium_polylepis.1
MWQAGAGSQAEASMPPAEVPAPNGRPRLLTAAADSSILMGGSWWATVVGRAVSYTPPTSRTAVYLGAANGDLADFYEFAKFGFDRAGFSSSSLACRHVATTARTPTKSDLDFISSATLIILSGGDPQQLFELHGVDKSLRLAASRGAVHVGISAGAIQLGTHGYPVICAGAPECAAPGRYPTLAMMPFVFGAHEEDDNWQTVLATVEQARGVDPSYGSTALGLPYSSAVALLYVGARFGTCFACLP